MKYIITWDSGFGESSDIVEAKDLDEALTDAYDAWKEEAENSASYDAVEYTEALAEELGLL